jgi:putative heme-binding domain-containing protein
MMRLTHFIQTSIAFVVGFLALAAGVRGDETPGFGARLVGADEPAKLVDVRKIWDQAPHNAFTDLVRFKGHWFCVFREGTSHVSPNGALRVLTSDDGEKWDSAALITSPTSDLRDAKITVTPGGGQLMLSGAEALHDKSKHTHQSLAWFSRDGHTWSERHDIGDPDFWLWRVTWHKSTAYGIGYGCGKDQSVRLYSSVDGKNFDTVIERLFDVGYPNESSLVFDGETCYCLLRRDGKPSTGLLGVSHPPYTTWEWKDLGTKIGGPQMIRLPDGRFVAAVRLYDQSVRTSLCWVDPQAGKITEFLKLPSGGDTSYAGMVWHEGLLWISYYSSHEGKTAIYLAKVHLPAMKQAAQGSPPPHRVPWTTSGVHGTPEPPLPYRVVRVFPQLTFISPLEAATIPGTNRMVVVELAGKILSLPYDDAVEKADLFADITQYDPEVDQVYSITFHPHFLENRFAYVWMIQSLHGQKNRPDGTRIVRFPVTQDNPPRLNLAAGKLIFAWLAGGHNGGNIRFGPDGMLYICTGDGSSAEPPDEHVAAQDIGSVNSKMLRIDVDHPDAGKAYGIPKDNPFVDMPGARGEVWAYGLRNPWRMGFDPKSGELYVGDVGWELWEMIYRIKRGGNYGWSITEGSKQDVRPDRLRGPTPILPPLVAHSHEEADSITGGEFYYGKKTPGLDGAYIYGDWQTGTFWSLRADGDRVTEHQELCHTSLMPVGFGVTPDKELLICDYGGGGIWRLAPNPNAGKIMHFPRKLSETGLFADVVQQTPAPGVVPYQINAARWNDHATAERWAALPAALGIAVAEKTLGIMSAGRWDFPDDTVMAKTYSLEMERGNPATCQRIETQILHYDGLQWAAYTYRWNTSQTDADLVPARGDETVFKVKDPAAPGGVLEQKWRFFSRVECLRCHSTWNNFAPGFSPLQLDRTTPEATGRQLDAFTRMGLTPDEPRLTDPAGTHGGIEIRARSYLHANCGTCHRFNGGGAVPTYLNIETPLRDSRLLRFKPVQGDFGMPEARVIAPGDPYRSALLYRMTIAGRGHMPYLGGKLVHDEGVLLVRDWIASMKPDEKDAANARVQREAEQLALDKLKAGDSSQLATLLTTGSGALSVALSVIDGSLPGEIRGQAIVKGGALVDPQKRDLFERFLPPSQRRKTLGDDFKLETLMSMNGNAARGKLTFSAVCAACHRVNGEGTDYGPDLSHIATKWIGISLLEQVRYPSKVIDPQWQLTNVLLTGGEVRSGFVISRSSTELSMKIAGGETVKIPVKQISKSNVERISAMPEGLLQSLTLREAGDLIEFLRGLN